jgi:Zn-dependent protease
VGVIFQLIAFLFAISIHESAHAWTANRCGDPTARMLGRVSLNPIKHIDPVGTVLLPLVAAIAHIPVLGWAKPTPVDPRNFKNPVADDILTSVAGPISNFLVATGALVCMFLISKTSILGHGLVQTVSFSYALGAVGMGMGSSSLVPVVLFLYELMLINVVLGVFNLIPVEIRALDPGRNSSKVQMGEYELEGPYFPGHLKGDRVTVCVRPERLTS